MVLIIVL